MPTPDMKTLVTFAQTRGFVYQGSEIYGGLANSWDYGPLGSALKDNVRSLWLKHFVQKRTDMVQLDSAILMNPQVWVASGHVGGFSDPLVDDKKTKERFRVDKLIEAVIESRGGVSETLHSEYREKYGVVNLVPESWPLEQMTAFLRGENVKNPTTKESADWTDVRKFNLMFTTKQGVTDDASATVYLRPETAQGIFVNFPNIARSSRKKVPFGVAQVGKAFRNEITPGNFIFRTREFEQMEIEYFCEPESVAPGKHLERHGEWKNDCMSFLTNVLWIKAENLKLRDHEKEELSHYSAATTDIEYLYPFGWGELWGIADRTDFDLNAHMKESGQDLSYFDPYTNTKYVPYVIEPSVGLSRLTLVVLLNAFDEIKSEEGSRVVMRFAPAVAPVKVGIYPIVKKFSEQGKDLFARLSEFFPCDYDESGTIGKRYMRSEEMGIPYAICVDADTITDDTELTIRDRDTGLQEKVSVGKMAEWLRSKGC